MEWPACATLTASATARCVFPTPGGPSNSTFSCRERNVRSNRLMTCVLSRSGWNAQSYSSMVFTNGSEASFSDVAMRRSSLDATSRSRTISSTESGERLSRSACARIPDRSSGARTKRSRRRFCCTRSISRSLMADPRRREILGDRAVLDGHGPGSRNRSQSASLSLAPLRRAAILHPILLRIFPQGSNQRRIGHQVSVPLGNLVGHQQLGAVENAQQPVLDAHQDLLADRPMRHHVAVAIEARDAVFTHAAEMAGAGIEVGAWQRPQMHALCLEALRDALAGGAVDARLLLQEPGEQIPVARGQARAAISAPESLTDEPDRALHLTLHPGGVRRTQPRSEAGMLRERMESLVPLRLLAPPADHRRFHAVVEDLGGHSAEEPERPLVRLHEIRQVRAQQKLGIALPAEAQHHQEHVVLRDGLSRFVAHRQLGEVHLGLLPGLGLESQEGLAHETIPHTTHEPLHRAQAALELVFYKGSCNRLF